MAKWRMTLKMMEIELTRQLFRRLVMLYLLLWPIVLGMAAFEVLNPKWSAFDTAFNSIVAEHLGSRPIGDIWLVVAAVVLGINFTASVGLLSFRPWARAAFLWPIVFLMPFALALGEPATYSSGFWELLGGIDMALFGAGQPGLRGRASS